MDNMLLETIVLVSSNKCCFETKLKCFSQYLYLYFYKVFSVFCIDFYEIFIILHENTFHIMHIIQFLFSVKCY